MLVDALRQPRVLVLDEAQRLPGPALEFLRGLWDHPDTDTALVLAGAGSERALRRSSSSPPRRAFLCWCTHLPRGKDFVVLTSVSVS
ncbi:ATP-binding protein [Streptomyces sp. CB01373]|uniref:ATP-binding protein n=1 Tax=Streptomyces sp. CB01373 TaxID=2020325 RepID=UPI002697DF65|nr:ATP-binding protein [Streptomyces sp. CB01373]